MRKRVTAKEKTKAARKPKKAARKYHKSSAIKSLDPKPMETEKRLAHQKVRAIQLHRQEGMTMTETAVALTKEFNLERVPTTTTIFRWVNDSMDLLLNEKYERMAIAYRMEQDAQIDELLRRWMPIALADHLRIQRWKQTAEGPEPFIDEHAYDESLKALDKCLKLMARRARLWNLDLTKVTVDSAEGPKSLQELQLYFNQVLIYGTGKKPDGTEVLSLEAGIENVTIV